MPASADDGWTQVGRKKGRLRHFAASSAPSHHQSSETSSFEVPPNANPSMTCDDIRRAHAAYKAEWECSDCRRALDAFLKDKAAALPTITKAVCLGSGSFDPANESWGSKRTAHIQVEAFLYLAGQLASKTGDRTECIAQEPAYTAADVEFLESLGCRVASGNSSFSDIDEHTLVVGVHLYMPTWGKALARALPAVVMTTDLEKFRESKCWESTGRADELIGRLAEVHAKYEMVGFPEMGHIFSTTNIYWRKEGGEVEGLAKVVEELRIDTTDDEVAREPTPEEPRRPTKATRPRIPEGYKSPEEDDGS